MQHALGRVLYCAVQLTVVDNVRNMPVGGMWQRHDRLSAEMGKEGWSMGGSECKKSMVGRLDLHDVRCRTQGAACGWKCAVCPVPRGMWACVAPRVWG